MFAVGMPSSRPRRSPATTSPSNRNGPPRNWLALSSSPAAASPRMWLPLTASPPPLRDGPADLARVDRLPLHLDERHHARLELGPGAEKGGVACRLLPEPEV